jgi:hypothetical protein
MALFTVVVSWPPGLAGDVRRLAGAAERSAAALEALLATVREASPDEAAVQAQIDAMVAQLTEANNRLEAAGQPPVRPES